MAKFQHRLKDLAVRKFGDGMHADGANLYLRVSGNGSARSWVFRYTDLTTRKLRDMGLGSATALSLKAARDRAADLRAQIVVGIDPLAERERKAQATALENARRMTFGECATAYIDAHAAGWRNAKHCQQWASTLNTHAALLKALPVAEITTDVVVRSLEKIWRTKTETASRVRQRIEAVLDWATVRHYRKGDNPARWKGHLDTLLPAPGKVTKVEHHAAIPWPEMPGFMAELRKGESMSAKALELVILTACRVGEMTGARWSEFDLDGAVWTIPADRMKAQTEHRVALCPRAVTVLKALPRVGEYVLPGISKAKPHMNPESLRKYLQADLKKADATPHGFRSAFRDWAAETTSYGAEVVEMALAHTIKSKVEAAYRRGDLFAKRAKLMVAWDNYLSKRDTAGLVVKFPWPAESVAAK